MDRDLRTKLTSRNIDPDSALTIVNTHLHFDHCRQNQSFPSASIYAQQAEIDVLASDPFYTVAAWANMPVNRSTIIDGDQEIADGISVLHTPGHTPGHQSVAHTIQQRNHRHRRTMLVDRQRLGNLQRATNESSRRHLCQPSSRQHRETESAETDPSTPLARPPRDHWRDQHVTWRDLRNASLVRQGSVGIVG